MSCCTTFWIFVFFRGCLVAVGAAGIAPETIGAGILGFGVPRVGLNEEDARLYESYATP